MIIISILLPCTADSLLLVADTVLNGIFMATTNNLNFNRLPLENVTTPVAVDYDPTENTVYWTDVGTGTLNAAGLDGSNQRILVQNLTSK